jgi:threonine dehydrogenase-like Zn-dependent dehydrogenase
LINLTKEKLDSGYIKFTMTENKVIDVLIKVSAVGICGSDIKILEGKHHYKRKHGTGS